MPNYCTNELTITSDNAGFLQSLMNELKQADSNEVDFLSKLVPFTEETNYVWDYDWCVENWGTKWDIFDVYHASLDGDTLTVCFTTAWSPPVSALQKATAAYNLEWELYWIEEGVCETGLAKGFVDDPTYVDESWELMLDDHPEEYIPGDILDTFPYIIQDWEECQQENDQEELNELQDA